MKKILTIALLFTAFVSSSQNVKWSEQLATTAMKIWPDSFSAKPGSPARWSYDQGVILKGVEGIWTATGDGKWFNYIQRSMDHFVQDDGTIKGYKKEDYNLDNINNGKLLLTLYRVTGKEKYKKAVDMLRDQLRNQPRTKEGGFWHKKVYPYQMWLDGLYMGEPFYAEYAMLFHEDSSFNDIANQFIFVEKHTRDPKTGLLYHGWDESREQKWANKQTGTSPNFWARAMGWYGMAMVDVLDYFPANHPGRTAIIAILNRFAKAVAAVQDPATGLWYDVPDKKNESKNYVEASASSMLVYALAKGVRKGYLPALYLNNAKKGYDGIIKKFIKEENPAVGGTGGQTNLYGTVSVSGLGGNPYRDGSFEYYMSEPVVVNDPKGMGAFIQAAVEMEMTRTLSEGNNKTVLLDYYFNNEWKKDATGTMVRWHYTWDDRANSGFSLLGNIFERHGMKTASLPAAPTAQNLKNASVYIIVDPDTDKETDKPNYMNDKDAKAIADWVKAGGVLLMMENDSANAEFKNFNKLPGIFGMTFNEVSKNRVQGNQFEQGVVMLPARGPFKQRKVYMKEVSTLRLVMTKNLTPVVYTLPGDDDVVIAIKQYGKGTVIAIGDPWFYNEYTDGRKLPAVYENYGAADDLVKWLTSQIKK